MGTRRRISQSSALSPTSRSNHRPWCRTPAGAGVLFYLRSIGASSVNGAKGRLRSTANKMTTSSSAQIPVGRIRELRVGQRRLRMAAKSKSTKGRLSTARAFSRIAGKNCPCTRSHKARVLPQPGQSHPVNACSGHGGKNTPCPGLPSPTASTIAASMVAARSVSRRSSRMSELVDMMRSYGAEHHQ